jgi:hypothetical protein
VVAVEIPVLRRTTATAAAAAAAAAVAGSSRTAAERREIVRLAARRAYLHHRKDRQEVLERHVREATATRATVRASMVATEFGRLVAEGALRGLRQLRDERLEREISRLARERGKAFQPPKRSAKDLELRRERLEVDDELRRLAAEPEETGRIESSPEGEPESEAEMETEEEMSEEEDIPLWPGHMPPPPPPGGAAGALSGIAVGGPSSG